MLTCGRGRPRKDNSFSRVIMFRGSEEHERMLDELESRLGENRADILREALEKYYYFKVLGQITYFE